MATKRRSKAIQIQAVDEISPRSSRRLRLKEDVKEEHEDEAQHTSSGMSLDVLAQVASETLENEPDSPQKITPKKLSMRTIQTMEVLNLEHILGLSEKTLISLFSDVESNEMKRTYTYTCYLIPKQCQKQCTSFGSEMRAYAEIKKHLYQHLDELKKEALSPSRKTKFKFTAEPIQVRKKRIYELLIPGVKKKKVKPGDFNIQIVGGSTDQPASALKPNQSSNSRQMSIDWEEAFTDNFESSDKSSRTGVKHIRTSVKRGNQKPPVLHNIAMDKPDDLDSDTEKTKNDEAERRIEENEQFIIDLLSKTQPHHDHNYTTVFGKRKGSDIMHHLMDDSDEERKGSSGGAKSVIYLDKNGNRAKRKAKPILFLRHRSPNENVPMVSKEEIINEYNGESDGEDDELVRIANSALYVNQKPERAANAAMSTNKLTYYKVGALNSFQDPFKPEELFMEKEPKSRLPVDRVPKVSVEKVPKSRVHPAKKVSAAWWEQMTKNSDDKSSSSTDPAIPASSKLALKLIKELKGKRKSDNVPLVCKICKDKTFTATATLMYHYRSHAGIKPFVCLICKTTFTRQHSLNYHMLIHNNQSRFTCSDCGRKFRHPSHFKEHLRRHTGETPFECSDCGQKFKTRNTYKRHLKTRHGKLLTATGISQMTKEEFRKVRTKPYKIPRLADIGYEMPDLTFTKIRKTSLGRRQKAHVDSEEYVDVEDILKTVDEIKQEIESDSDTESANTETACDGTLNSSGAQEELLKKLAIVPKTEVTENTKDETAPLNVLQVLTGGSGQSGNSQVEFMEVTPKVERKARRRGNISIEIVEGGQNVDTSNNTNSAAASSDKKSDSLAEDPECSKVPIDNISICVPMRVPIDTR